MDYSIPFAHSKTLAVNIPVDPQGKIDKYLENCIAVVTDIGNNRARLNAAMPLAIHAISRPLSQKEPVPRDEMTEP